MGLMHMIRVANLTYQSMCLNGCPLNCWGRNVFTRWRNYRQVVHSEGRVGGLRRAFDDVSVAGLCGTVDRRGQGE